MVAAVFRTIFPQPDAESVSKAWDEVRDQLTKSFPKQLVSPVRERFMPLDRSVNTELVDALRGLLPHDPAEPVAPGLSRSVLHSALIHRPAAAADSPQI